MSYYPVVGKKMRRRMRRRRRYLLSLGISEECLQTEGPFGVEVHAWWDGITVKWHAAYAYPVIEGSVDLILSRPADMRLLMESGLKDYKGRTDED